MDNNIKKVKKIFEKNSSKIFIIDAIMGQEYTYGQVEDLSLRLASVLAGLGLKRGEVVAVMLSNCIEFVFLYFACMQLGVIVAPVNPALTGREIKHILYDSGAKMLITSDKLSGKLAGDKVFSLFIIKPSCDLEHGQKDAPPSLLKLAAREKPFTKKSFSSVDDNDIFVISYTSGTTALPKGVTILYKNFIGNGSLFIKTLGIDSGARFYTILPMAYMGGWYNLTFIPLLAEGSMVLDQAFNPLLSVHFWDNVIKYRVNTLWLVPSIMSILLAVDRGRKGAVYCRKNIKTALVGTAPLASGLKAKFEKKYTFKLNENYALSETFFITTNSPKLAINKGVGRVIEGCAVAAVDEKGKVLPTGQAGEIVVNTPFHTPGYYKNPKATAELIREAGIYTGDIGYLDKDNYLFIVGRKKDIIIKGGVNISPAEIEDVISNHPLVSEVVAVGISDKIAGEEIVALVKTKKPLTEKALKEFCSQSLAHFKIPKYIKFVKDFPRTATGKVQKNKIKEALAKIHKYDN